MKEKLEYFPFLKEYFCQAVFCLNSIMLGSPSLNFVFDMNLILGLKLSENMQMCARGFFCAKKIRRQGHSDNVKLFFSLM